MQTLASLIGMALALAEVMYCRACFTNLPDTADRCRACGRDPRLPVPPGGAPADAAPMTTGTPPVAEPPASGPRWARAAAVGLAAAVVLSAGLVGGRRAERRGEPPAGPAAVESVVARLAERQSAELPEDLDEAALGGAASLYRQAVEAHGAGDRARALALLREAAAAAPGEPVVEAALTLVLEDLAAERMRTGAFAAAETLLAEAVERDSGRGEAWKALGYAQLRQDRLAEAQASLGEAARLLPGDAEARLLYGTVLYRAGDTRAAVVELRAGRPAAAGDAGFEALLAKAEREAEAERGHTTAESPHFRVSVEGGGTSEQAGYLVSLLLEEAYHRVGTQLDYYPTEPVHAVLYPAETFRDVTRTPAWAGALYDGKIRIPVGGLTDRTEALSRTVAHEYTHALVHRLTRGRAPLWLNEGLAQLAEGPVEGRDREAFRAYVRNGGRLRSLRALEGGFAGLDAQEASLAYRQSLAVTDFLVTRYGPATSRRLLDRLGEGAPLASAIEELLYVRYEDLERQWLDSYR